MPSARRVNWAKFRVSSVCFVALLILFTLIYLLTGGGPKMLGGGNAGETDILVSYTYTLAFRSSENNYALASAIATLLFFLVGTLAWINLRMSSRRIVY